MPPIPRDKMTDAQKKAADELVAGPRGALAGPFGPLLRSPEFMSRLQETGEYLRFSNGTAGRSPKAQTGQTDPSTRYGSR